MNALDLSARELSDAYASGALSPVDVTRACLERIASREDELNAMYIVDRDGAMSQAEASERRHRAGEALGPLDGVPITIKENIATRGDPSPLGVAGADLTPAPDDAPPAARVREAGCVILGKTTMPDFGMLASGVSSFHGVTRNPWDTSRNTYGSSSGAAAGLAARYAPLALGTDIGGSVRLPGAATGTFALKPSLGRIPIHPPYLGRVTGPMTRTVADAALLMNELTRPDARDFMALAYEEGDWVAGLDRASADGKRFGLVLDIGMGMAATPAIRDVVTGAAEMLEAAGAIVEPVDPFLDDEILLGVDRFFGARLLADVERLSSERQAQMLPFVRTWTRRAEALSATDALRALATVLLMAEKTHGAIQGYDFLLSPTIPTSYPAESAAPGDDPDNPFLHIGFTSPFNFSEQPAASICAGYDADGMPVGLQIAGHRFDDAGVLAMASAYEALRPPMRPWPD